MPVSEDGDNTLIEDQVKNGSNREEVELGVGFFAGKGVIEVELVVVYELGNAIDFELALVNGDGGVRAGDCVDLAARQFLLENGALLDAYANF